MNGQEPSSRRVTLMGAAVDLVTPAEIMQLTADRIAEGRKAIVANHNAHSLAVARRDPMMRRFYAMADVVAVDSMPLIAWGRLLGLPLRARHRSTYLDWRETFWRLAQERGWRVFCLGGAPGVGERAAVKLRARWPGVQIGVHHGFFDQSADSDEGRAVVATINAFAPDVLFVGLGMPLQERWIEANHARFERGVVFSIGAAFDYEAGVQVTPPRWAGRAGLEWLFRFAADPRRLFTRYFLEPWSLVGAAMLDVRRALTRATA